MSFTASAGHSQIALLLINICLAWQKISSVDFSFIHRAYFICQADICNPLRYLLDSVKSDR